MARAIMERIEACGWTKAEVARQAGMHRQQLQTFLDHGGNVRTLHRVAAALECTPADLMMEAQQIEKEMKG